MPDPSPPHSGLAQNLPLILRRPAQRGLEGHPTNRGGSFETPPAAAPQDEEIRILGPDSKAADLADQREPALDDHEPANPPSHPTNHPSRLIGIDALRILAATLVMIFHLAYWSWAPPTSTAKPILAGAAAYPDLAPIAWWGWIGVHLFFVISGAVIANSAGRADAYAFARSRFLRLFPGVLVCATISLLVALLAAPDPPAELLLRTIRALLFSPAGPWIDGVYWTLWIEIAFYSLVFLLLLAHRRAWIEPVVLTIGAISAAVWTATFLSGTPAYPTLFGLPNRIAELTLLQHGLYFALGLLLWNGARQGWTPPRALLAILLTAAGTLPIIVESAQKAVLPGVGPAIVPVAVWLAGTALLALAIGPLAHWRPARGASAIALLGLASYPLYLLHDLVGAALLRTLIVAGLDRLAALVLVMAAMIALAIAVTLALERPLRSLIGTRLLPAARSQPH